MNKFFFSYSKVVLEKPSLLLKCEGIVPCGKQKRLNGPCDVAGEEVCMYRNFSYQAVGISFKIDKIFTFLF